MQNTRDANDHAHAKRFARKKRSVSRVATTNNTQEIAHMQNTFGRRMYGITTCTVDGKYFTDLFNEQRKHF